jgi:hypothetical protein
VTANGGDFASTPLGAYPSKALRIGYADDEEYNAVGLASGGKPLPVVLYNIAQDAIGSSVSGSIPLVISGTVTANNVNLSSNEDGGGKPVLRTGVYAYDYAEDFQVGVAIIQGTPAGPALNIGGTVTIGGGTVTIGAGTAQIGSVTVGNSVTIGSCVTHGVTIANSVVTFYPLQGTTVTNSNFTSTTASTTLVSAVAGREVLTVFNEGAGNLHISPGATCTTVAYQVRLSAGDYWECPAGQLSLAHTAVFSTAGTARVTEVS